MPDSTDSRSPDHSGEPSPERSAVDAAAPDERALRFFQQAIETPSPSGFEEPIQALIGQYVEPHADQLRTDVHGNLIASIGDPAGPRVMFAGHSDQIGMLVTYIDDGGFIYAQAIGGWDPQQLIGQGMTIWTAAGPLPAVISRKAIHLLTTKERARVAELEELWLDIGAADKADAQSRVRVGDAVTLELKYRPLIGDLVSGPGMDNKSGMWTVMESLRMVAQSSQPLQCHLHSVATVQEEIGLRGAQTAANGIKPSIAIAVDVTHATDCPKIDKQQHGDISLGKGPVIFRGPNINTKVAQRLIDLCESHSLPYQLAAIGRATPNDANVLQISGAGVATGLVAVPNRYMHSAVEVISTRDIQHVATLLARFAQSISTDDDFTPSVD